MRGTAGDATGSPDKGRITPACAGNRPTVPLPGGLYPDHPRVCGEQSWFGDEVTPAAGSPPRVRGTGNADAKATTLFRITPACAGNRPRRFSANAAQWDHPRVCGEQIMGVSRPTVEKGSPPRVRGTGSRCSESHLSLRITPACAGNSCAPAYLSRTSWDHPRVCGEQTRSFCAMRTISGSPPRVRGTA